MKALSFGIVSALVATSGHAETTCIASYYGKESGRYTANRERFNPMGYTAASLSYSFGTMLRVSFHRRSIVVRVNDIGPAKKTKRCIDLSQGAAEVLKLKLGLVRIRKVG